MYICIYVYIYRITRIVNLLKYNHHQFNFMLQFYASCHTIYNKLKPNFIKMHLRGKCSPVNILHVVRKPICKTTTGGYVNGFYERVS